MTKLLKWHSEFRYNIWQLKALLGVMTNAVCFAVGAFFRSRNVFGFSLAF